MTEDNEEMWETLQKTFLTTEEKLQIIKEYNLYRYDEEFRKILEEADLVLKRLKKD